MVAWPSNAPPNSDGVEDNENREATNEEPRRQNRTAETQPDIDTTKNLEDPKDDDSVAKARPRTSAATQQSDGSQPAANASDDATTAQAAAAAKRRRESPGFSDEHRLKQLEREWSRMGNKKGKLPAQQPRSLSASRTFRP